MKLTEEQLEALKAAAGRTALTFAPKVVLDLIADLREARAKLAESKSAYRPDSDHQSRYYVEQQGFWFWVVKCGTGTRTIFKSRTQIGAIEMAQELQTAFLDGEFIGQKAKLAEAEKDAALSFVSLPHWGHTKFKLGDQVRKIKGSQWHGRIVGTYSTSLTPEGYAVESSTEQGSVQIYPASALEFDCVVQQEEAK